MACDAGTDFDTINNIYRDIFKFILMDHHPEGAPIFDRDSPSILDYS
jgi:hypothetical protein